MRLKYIIPLYKEIHREIGELLIFCNEVGDKTYIIKCLLNNLQKDSLENKIIEANLKEKKKVIEGDIRDLDLQINNFINNLPDREEIEFKNINITNKFFKSQSKK